MELKFLRHGCPRSKNTIRLFTVVYFLVFFFFFFIARLESRETWTPTQNGRLDRGGDREKTCCWLRSQTLPSTPAFTSLAFSFTSVNEESVNSLHNNSKTVQQRTAGGTATRNSPAFLDIRDLITIDFSEMSIKLFSNPK